MNDLRMWLRTSHAFFIYIYDKRKPLLIFLFCSCTCTFYAHEIAKLSISGLKNYKEIKKYFLPWLLPARQSHGLDATPLTNSFIDI